MGLTDSKVTVEMPGGTMEIEILEDGTALLTGNVGYVGSIRLGSGFSEELINL